MTTTLFRLPDWRLRFDSLVYSRLHLPFAWGSNDCALFAADAVLAVTGVDLAAQLRGHGTALQAARTLRRNGGVRGIAISALGEPCSVNDASQGDILLINAAGRDALAVCLDSAISAAPGPMGLSVVPTNTALIAWRIG